MSLVKSLKNGHQKALKELYHSYGDRVFRFLDQHLDDQENIIRSTHDIFTKIWTHRNQLNATSDLENLLFHYTKQQITDYYRKKITKIKGMDFVLLEAIGPLPEGIKLNETTNKMLQAAIEELPFERRQIFKMSTLQGLTDEEIANRLSLSKTTIDSHLSQAVQYIKHKIANTHQD